MSGTSSRSGAPLLRGGVGRALGLGAISGLRSMSGPAFVSSSAAKDRVPLDGTRLAFLGSPIVSKLFLLAAAGELVGDKLPSTPSRTAPPPLIGRAGSGALVGAAIFASEGRRAAAGGAIGAAAAVVAAYAGERLRARLGEITDLPDPAVALVEDWVVLYTGYHLTR